MRSFRSLARFTKGLVTDLSGVQGGLLEAHNVYPIRRGAGYQGRGSKRNLDFTSSPLVVTGGRFAWPVDLPNYKGIMWFATTSYDTDPSTRFVPYLGFPTALLNNTPLTVAGAVRTGVWGTPTIYGSTGSAAALGPEMLFPAPSNRVPMKWSGRSNNGYATGTVAGALNGSVLTGTGTSWLANANVGDYIWINSGTLVAQRYFRITEVTSNTSMKVDGAFGIAFTGQTYRLDGTAPWTCLPGTFGRIGLTSALAADSTVQVGIVAQHRGRLFGGGTVEIDNVSYPDRLRWCAPVQEASGQWHGSDYWHANAYLDIFPGQGGGSINGLASMGSTLFVFKANAVYAVRGDVETDGRDVGATVTLVSDQDGLFGAFPVVTPQGVLFCGRKGLWLLTDSGMTNLTSQGGIQSTYQTMFLNLLTNDITQTQQIMALSVTDDRVIVHATQSLELSSGANALVWHTAENTWTTQQTYSTTRVLKLPDKPPGPDFGQIVGWVALARMEEWAKLSGTTYTGTAGAMIRWDDDFRHTAGSAANEGANPVLASLTTHPISLAADRDLNGRIRTVMAKAVLSDDQFGTPSSDPKAQVTVLLGEEGTSTAVEAIITAADQIAQPAVGLTERWYRVPIRLGSPPVDQARIRIAQLAAADRFIVYEVGAEVIGVGRVRK